MEQSGIRVVIVEDDPDWLRGLQSYLQKEPDIRLVGHASSGKAAVELLEKTEADVVLMDIMMSDSPEGIWAAAEIVKCSGARVIMLSSMEDKELIFDAFKGRGRGLHGQIQFHRNPAGHSQRLCQPKRYSPQRSRTNARRIPAPQAVGEGDAGQRTEKFAYTD